ncbi:zinc finger protein [Hyphodiscus hymeniophilus]|uniref:Zinc finger protein n=1 Tax=Hyphodiscus hymeniophilus TaxID=353542 RepID=A0A9P6VIE2_9HELO|nr:zinc finger protein [Hyphodiscus hymeniophilus]
MAKRSREDFEPSTPDSEKPGDTEAGVRLVVHQSTVADLPSNSSKIIHLDSDSGEARPAPEMICSLPPHRQTLSFSTYEDYEVHYLKSHTNRCTECRKNLPTEHFLSLHIEENHDSLVSVRKERGEKTYACFVEDCDRKCSTPQKRRMHLVDKHFFPKDYDFYVVNDGIDRRSSMLRSGRHRRQSSAAQNIAITDEKARHRSSTLETNTEVEVMSNGEQSPQEVSPEGTRMLTPESSQEDADMEGLAGAMSALKFIPPSVRFGHRGRGRGRGGFSKT